MFFRWKHKRVAGVITVALLCLRIFYRCADYSVLVILSYKYPSEREPHPELKSRPNRPHPLFRGFVDSALKNMRGN